jgi:GNAT superfamily N-acetyltransferase
VLAIRPLERGMLDEAARLVAREQVEVRARRPGITMAFTEPQICYDALADLLANGFPGFVARDDGRCVGVMCGGTTDDVGFVPSHGLVVDPKGLDPTDIAVGLFAELAPVLLGDGALRFTIDQVDLDPLGSALNNLGFGRAAVFATQPARPAGHGAQVDVRIGTSADLGAITALSHIEFTHRSTAPIYAPPNSRTLADTGAIHERLFEEGAVHFLARREGNDVGLVTVEFTSPAPRLCPNGQPYIGPTATHPSAQRQGIGHALVHSVLDWAHAAGYRTVSVDFDSPNPRSRPFWLGLGFKPTGYRVHRTIDATYRTLGCSATG